MAGLELLKKWHEARKKKEEQRELKEKEELENLKLKLIKLKSKNERLKEYASIQDQLNAEESLNKKLKPKSGFDKVLEGLAGIEPPKVELKKEKDKNNKN